MPGAGERSPQVYMQQRRVARVVSGVRVGAEGDQPAHRLHVAADGCPHFSSVLHVACCASKDINPPNYSALSHLAWYASTKPAEPRTMPCRRMDATLLTPWAARGNAARTACVCAAPTRVREGGQAVERAARVDVGAGRYERVDLQTAAYPPGPPARKDSPD